MVICRRFPGLWTVTEHRAQHHLQQAYLRGFSPHRFDADAKNYEKNQIGIYSKSEAVIRMGSIPKIAFRPYQYSFKKSDGTYSYTLEKGFADLESKFSALLSRLGEIFHVAKTGGVAPSPVPEDHATLCEYIFIHIIRVPAALNPVRKGIEEIGRAVEQDFGLPKNPDEDQRWTVYALADLGAKFGPKAQELLMRKIMRVEFFPRTKTSIVTCDNPVVRAGNAGGLVFPETQVFFPLDQRSFVRLHGSGTDWELQDQRDLSIAADFNLMMIGATQEEAYCSDPTHLQGLLRKQGIEATIVPPKFRDKALG